MRVTISVLALLVFAVHVAPARAASGEGGARVLELRRTLDLEAGAAVWATTYDKYIVYQADATTILGVDIGTGLIRWRHVVGETPIRHILRSAQHILVVAADLQLVDLARGRILWSYPLGCRRGGRCQTEPVWWDENWVVLAGFNESPDSLQVVDLQARADSWPAWAKVGPIGKVSADERMILVSNPEGTTVTALDRAVGRLRWTVELPEVATRAPGSAEMDRMWTTPEAVHVFRGVAGGRRPSLIFSLSPETGGVLRTARGAICPSDGVCGAQPAETGVVTFGVSDAGRPGHVTVHDLDAGTRPVDDQAYFAAPPLTLAGRVVVLPRRDAGQLVLDTLLLPRGKRLWRRGLADVPGAVRLLSAPGVLTVVQESRGLIHGLSLRDGSIQTFGAMDTGGEPIVEVFPCESGVLVTTARKLFLFAERPIGEMAEALRKALAQGNHAQVEAIDQALVQLAGDLEAAAEAHGLVLRHAALATTAALARGEGAEALARAAELLSRSPARAVASLVAFSRAFHKVLVDWLIPEPQRLVGELGAGLEELAKSWLARIEAAGGPLAGAEERVREPLLAFGLALVESLERGGRGEAAWAVLRSLAATSLGLVAESLSPVARRGVARQLAPEAREALAEARAGRVRAALDRLVLAAGLPLAAAVTGGRSPLLAEIESLRVSGDRADQKKVAHVALRAYKEWGEEPAPDARMDELVCFESCQRAWQSCEGPCVSRAACDKANMACVSACETTGRALWPRPLSEPPPEDPAFMKCL